MFCFIDNNMSNCFRFWKEISMMQMATQIQCRLFDDFNKKISRNKSKTSKQITLLSTASCLLPIFPILCFYWNQIDYFLFRDLYLFSCLTCELVLHFTGNSSENVLHILVSLSRCLHVYHSLIFRKSLSLLPFHLSLTSHVTLISDQNPNNFPCAVSFNLAHPHLDVFKTFPVTEIEDQDDSLGSLIVSRSDSFEFFLTSSVPHLELDHAALMSKGPYLEVHSYGGIERFLENVVREPQKEARFSNCRVSDEKGLENKVVVSKSHLLLFTCELKVKLQYSFIKYQYQLEYIGFQLIKYD